MARKREQRRLRTEVLESRRMLAAGDLEFKTTIPIVTNQDDLSTTMAVQPWDGAIVLAGDTFPPGQKVQSNNVLARVTSTGAIDNSFGTVGRVATAVGTGTDHISGVTFQFTDATTKYIIVAGYSVVSFNDLSFTQDPQNGNLVVTSPSRLFQRADIGSTLAITGGANWTTGSYRITNITTDNRAILDKNPSTFGIPVTGGQWTLNNYDFVVSRYFADTPAGGPAEGTLDTSFGPLGTGHAIYPVGPHNDFGYAVKVQPWDQKIVVVGYSDSIQGVYDFSVMRLTPQGILDTAGFNASGAVPGVGQYTIQDNDYANTLDFDLTTHSILMGGSAGGGY